MTDDRKPHTRAMTLERFRTILDAHGAAMEKWPSDERKAARALLSESSAARDALNQTVQLDALLDSLQPPAASPALAQRVIRAGHSGSHNGSHSGNQVGGDGATLRHNPGRLAAQWLTAHIAPMAVAGLVGLVLGIALPRDILPWTAAMDLAGQTGFVATDGAPPTTNRSLPGNGFRPVSGPIDPNAAGDDSAGRDELTEGPAELSVI